MNFNFPKIKKIEIIGLNFNERKKIENIINDANFENIFYLDKQYLQKNNHDIKYKNMTSGLNIIWKKNKFWQGIADPRREGFAIGY